MCALALSFGSIKDTKNLSMVPRSERVGRLWSAQATMVHAWHSVRNRGTERGGNDDSKTHLDVFTLAHEENGESKL